MKIRDWRAQSIDTAPTPWVSALTEAEVQRVAGLEVAHLPRGMLQLSVSFWSQHRWVIRHLRTVTEMSDRFPQGSSMFLKPKHHSYLDLTPNISTRLEFNASIVKQVPPRLPARIQTAKKKDKRLEIKG